MECIYIFICLIVSVSVKAQYAVGFNGGISIPKLQGNSEQSKGYTSRSGVYAGLLASIKLSKLFYLQPEVNISPQGGIGMVYSRSLPMQWLEYNCHQAQVCMPDITTKPFSTILRYLFW